MLKCEKPGCLVVLREDERKREDDEPEIEMEGPKVFITCPGCGHRNELRHKGTEEWPGLPRNP
jgi:hypothetical protein